MDSEQRAFIFLVRYNCRYFINTYLTYQGYYVVNCTGQWYIKLPVSMRRVVIDPELRENIFASCSSSSHLQKTLS